MPCEFCSLELDGLRLIVPQIFEDERGIFLERYKRSEFVRAGIAEVFVQDNFSVSRQGVLRGLHFQKSPSAQAKLVSVSHGRVWDVAVDLRPDSETFGRWIGCELSAENRKMLYIPAGFAHGFVTLSTEAHFAYTCTAEYDQTAEAGIRWDDPTLAIEWPVTDPIVSEKDRDLPFLEPREEL